MKLPIIQPAFVKMLQKKWKYGEAVRQLLIEFKRAMFQLEERISIIFLWSVISL